MSGRRLLEVRTADHWVLELERIPARGQVRGAAVLGHAMMVDRRSLDRPRGDGLASTLARRGWEVFLCDLRGRGRGRASAGEGADWSYDDLVRHDLPALVEAARRACPRLPVVVVGHSLAGHVSLAAAGCGLYPRPPDAHVLIAANVWLPAHDPDRSRRAIKRASVLALRLATRTCGRIPARRLRIGPIDEAGGYARQLADFYRAGRWRSRDGAHDYLAGLARVPGPVLAVYGRGDRLLAHPGPARRWAAPIPGLDLWICGRGDRGLDFDPDHMQLACDPRARPLWRAIAGWMGARAGESRPRAHWPIGS